MNIITSKIKYLASYYQYIAMYGELDKYYLKIAL